MSSENIATLVIPALNSPCTEQSLLGREGGLQAGCPVSRQPAIHEQLVHGESAAAEHDLIGLDHHPEGPLDQVDDLHEVQAVRPQINDQGVALLDGVRCLQVEDPGEDFFELGFHQSFL